MRAAATFCAAIALSLVLVSCASVDELPPDNDSTTLRRFDGEPLRKRDIMGRRPSAMALARALANIERGLREPWAENRDAGVLLEEVGKQAPADVRTAKNLWRLAEPVPPGLRREAFGEYGFYADAAPNHLFLATIRPETLEEEVAAMLREHSDKNERALLLAAWRRFSPEVSSRRDNYLASNWCFELGGARVAVVESLLGPHRRSHVLDAGKEMFGGVNVTIEGYALPEGLAMLVMPGESSPVAATIDALAKTGKTPASVEIDGGVVHVGLSQEDREFLKAALKGLAEGCCDVEYLPRGCTRFEATLDYLIGNAEARATLRFARTPDGWRLDRFVYEPAAASVIGRDGAALDLIAMLRKGEPESTVSGK
ncbi:hypothetical protein PLCT1_02634 [Planctomycetaceae bacterium]|nr:hypothetical protein PLCT1_02634 [Planctomycetaceae bacterium]